MYVGSGDADQQRQCLDSIYQPLRLSYRGIGSSFGTAAKVIFMLENLQAQASQSNWLRVPMLPSKLNFHLTIGCQILTGTGVHKLAFMPRLLWTASHIQAV